MEDKEGLLLPSNKMTRQRVETLAGKLLCNMSKEEVIRACAAIESLNLQAQLQKVLDAGYKSPEWIDEHNNYTFNKAKEAYEAKIEEAKKQERERVIAKLEKILGEPKRYIYDDPGFIFYYEISSDGISTLKSSDKGE